MVTTDRKCNNPQTKHLYLALSFFSGHYVIGWFSMSPLPRLHHHDIMTIVGLFVPFVTLQYVEYHMVKKQMKILSLLIVAEDDSTDNL